MRARRSFSSCAASREAFDLLGREVVLAPVGLAVPIELREPGLLREVLLPEPVDADHPERVAAAGVRQGEAALGGARQAARLQMGEQVGRAPRLDRQRTRQALERRRARLVLAVVEVLERVLHENPPVRAAHPDRVPEEPPPRAPGQDQQSRQHEHQEEPDGRIQHLT